MTNRRPNCPLTEPSPQLAVKTTRQIQRPHDCSLLGKGNLTCLLSAAEGAEPSGPGSSAAARLLLEKPPRGFMALPYGPWGQGNHCRHGNTPAVCWARVFNCLALIHWVLMSTLGTYGIRRLKYKNHICFIKLIPRILLPSWNTEDIIPASGDLTIYGVNTINTATQLDSRKSIMIDAHWV